MTTTTTLLSHTTAYGQINASKRMKEAARERAEGDKVVQVKIAEAAAEVRATTILV